MIIIGWALPSPDLMFIRSAFVNTHAAIEVQSLGEGRYSPCSLLTSITHFHTSDVTQSSVSYS